MFSRSVVWLLLSGILGGNPAIFAQTNDSILSQQEKKAWVPVAMSMVIPGSGQLYNKSYLRAPLITGAFTAGIYSTIHYRRLYNNYKKIYDLKLLSIQEPLQYPDFYPNYTITELKQYSDRYQIFSDISMASALAVYLVNVVDAYAGTQTAHNPRAATIMSAIMPGSGQVYNKKFWKVPVIYGGFATLYFFSEYNHKYYIKYRDMYNQKIASQTNPNLVDPAPQVSAEALRLQREDWRRYRDLNYIGMGLLYILNIIDANVDANLIDYDVSDNLSMTIVPECFSLPGKTFEFQPYFGTALTIKF